MKLAHTPGQRVMQFETLETVGMMLVVSQRMARLALRCGR